MGWEDGQYYRDSGDSTGRTLLRSIFFGSVPLFTAFGIRVRVHATLLWYIGLVIVLDQAKNFPFQTRVISMAMLGASILLHEFGHCFAARAMGGNADDILMWPLGGLAFTDPPRRPWPVFVTVVCGPLVNVAICVLCIIGVYALGGHFHSFNPFSETGRVSTFSEHQVGYYVFWLFLVNYGLLLFNMIPMYPMDCGQMLQCVMWPKLGYRRSTHIACIVGMVMACLVAGFGLFTFNLLLVSVAVTCFLYCRSRMAMLREMGDDYEYGQEPMDFSASLRPDPPRRRRRASRWAIRRIQRQAESERNEQERIDSILAKVSAKGMQSLTWSERRALHRATDRQRKREVELKNSL